MMNRCFIVYWLVLGGLLFYLFSIHKLYYDVSVFIPVSNVPRSTFSELSNPFTSIWENVCSLTVFSTFLPFPYILFPIRKSESSLTVFSTILPFTNIISSIRGIPFSISIFFTILPFTNILVPIGKSSCSLTMLLKMERIGVSRVKTVFYQLKPTVKDM